MTVEAVRAELARLAEPAYQRFTAALLPGVDNVIGVRSPALRRLAKQLARGDWEAFLRDADGRTHEEMLLRCMVIGYAKGGPDALLPHIAAQVERLRNWSDCDVFCSGLKLAKAHPDALWAFVAPYFDRAEPYPLRFAIVMSLTYYLGPAYLPRVLTRLDAVSHEDYYVKMAVAWAVSMAYVADPEAVRPLLAHNHMDDWTHNKALQKIIESRQVDDDTRAAMRALKRKGARAHAPQRP